MKIREPHRFWMTVVTLCLLTGVMGNGLAFCDSPQKAAPVKQSSVALDFKVLEQTAQYVTADESDLREIPPGVQSLNGKVVRITGYLLLTAEGYYTEKPITNFAISKGAYGCPCCNWGDPPTIFNTLMVDLKSGETLKPPFMPLVEVIGTFIVKKEQFVDEEGKKRLNVLFYIKDAHAHKKKKPF